MEIRSLVDRCEEYVTTYPLYTYWILSHYFNKTCKVAEINSSITGFISGIPSSEKPILFIWQLCVLQKFRKRGIASRLIDSIVKKAIKNNYQIEFTISSKNIASINLFTKYAKQNNITIQLEKEARIGTSTELLYRYSF
jgi:diaminobutyrate acetyltransferase